jgi:hypothetical protein
LKKIKSGAEQKFRIPHTKELWVLRTLAQGLDYLFSYLCI